MASNEMENSEETMFFKKKEEDNSIGFVEFGKIAATYRLPAGKVCILKKADILSCSDAS